VVHITHSGGCCVSWEGAGPGAFRGTTAMGVILLSVRGKRRTNNVVPPINRHPKWGKASKKLNVTHSAHLHLLWNVCPFLTHTNAHVSLSIHLECLTREKRSHWLQNRSHQQPNYLYYYNMSSSPAGTPAHFRGPSSPQGDPNNFGKIAAKPSFLSFFLYATDAIKWKW